MKIARFGLSLFGVNMYVVWDPDTRDCAIIDPGIINEREKEALTSFISREKLNVTHLINTHLHIDHSIGDNIVKKLYGVDIEAHPSDNELGKQLSLQARNFGIPLKTNDIEIAKPLHDGDIIPIGNEELQVIHVPGHSPGGIALYCPSSKFVISGDILFKGSVGRTDLPGGNTAQLLNGIKDKLLTLPENTDVFPGHGDATTIGEEKKYNPFLRH